MIYCDNNKLYLQPNWGVFSKKESHDSCQRCHKLYFLMKYYKDKHFSNK